LTLELEASISYALFLHVPISLLCLQHHYI